MEQHLPNLPIGYPACFSIDNYLDVVEQVICADEIQNAFWMLDHMPGYFRDNPPERALEIKRKLYRQLMTVEDYCGDEHELEDKSVEDHAGYPLKDHWNLEHYWPRGHIIVERVKALNEQGCCADIYEFGPANYWVYHSLLGQGLDFKYHCSSIGKAKKVEKNDCKLEKTKQVFICFEVIEHMWSPDDIFHYYFKAGLDADIILMSTPKYTLFGGLPGWDSRPLGHIRTYTPNELLNFVTKHCPKYSYKIFDANMMVLEGTKI
jgi:hypothetical protein